MPNEGPNFVVVFVSDRTDGDQGYAEMAGHMADSVAKFDGYLGAESVRDASGHGITVSYWRSLDDIARWKADAEHLVAQRLGKEAWYTNFRLTVARVEKDVIWKRS